ncbi:hypothetical protein [Nocardia sp. NRRL S-836]|uniref:hypothetical protein n=1 Tax=Nocardia sp. NRRL S-836 TaxID=1519492 RepID=UPI0006AE695B|nr:hypothetical protein [Nocardia sp. NRRL S-836]KOV83958.1 hypothetical protein ADL03_19045 [Nocardia sp. NRRL S-836]
MIKPDGPGEDVPGGDEHKSGPAPMMNFGLGSGRVSIDTDALMKAAALFQSASSRFYHYMTGNQELASYAPLNSPEGDDSWSTFAPKYYKRGAEYLGGIGALAKGIDMLGQSVKQFAAYCVATEENNTHVAKNALNLNGAPEPGNIPGQWPEDDSEHHGRR